MEVESIKDGEGNDGESSGLSWQRRPLPSQSGFLSKSSKRNIRPKMRKSALLLGRPYALFLLSKSSTRLVTIRYRSS